MVEKFEKGGFDEDDLEQKNQIIADILRTRDIISGTFAATAEQP